MSIPSKERIGELVADLVSRQGYDLEDVAVTQAGRHSAVRIMVDGDRGLGLDAAAALSRDIGELFDATPDFGETPYTLEVTSPGIDRPLTHERHWRRARGRLARIDLAGETVTGRIGPVDGPEVAVVVGGSASPTVRTVRLDEVENAVVQVEFSKPSARELELAGGIPEGRVSPLDPDVAVDAPDGDAPEDDAEDREDGPGEETKGQDK